MSLSRFHPAVSAWFQHSFERPTNVQLQAWDAIDTSDNVLIAAPTGSGKTFAAFLRAIDELVRSAEQAPLEDGVQVLYVSPLKALSNDIERNLQLPLQGIERWLAENGGRRSGIRAMVRTGDTSQGDRERMRRKPPQILVTTPESLYLLLTSDSGRAMLSTVRHLIVDEIHAIADSKRGSHLSLSLARLETITPQNPRRIGLSATQKPIETIAKFLTGGAPCMIVDTGHQRHRDLALELPGSPVSAVMANEVWEEIYDRLEQLISEHRTTLIFVNTRRLAERCAKNLAERIGDESITAHHGSLSRDHRLEAEQALKSGRLRALVATASLELGIDIGHVDLVCQLGSPGSISGFIQRVGRSGHGVGETPKGRLFPISRDDLVEGVALLRSVNEGKLDTICIPEAPLDVLAQHLVAEISAREWQTDELFELVRQAWPYRELERERFDQVVDMLATGYATRRGRRAAYVYHDAINGRLRARPAARLVALQNGGAIPDHFDYEVVMMPQGFRVGTLNEDFAFESLPGDIFQLGNTSYRMLKIETGRVLVEDAQGQPPTIPFWFGDAPGRSDELSLAVSDLRSDVDRELQAGGSERALEWLLKLGISGGAAAQVCAYLQASREALGAMPTHLQVVMERFFDDSGDMHLVIHAPLGSRIMRAWGLALRKRFCRNFNFELQASALEDCLILSLGETHSFETDEVASYLKPESVRRVLIQALLDVPMFETRWRWNATIALAVQRMRNGQKIPPQWQRNAAEDLVAVVFPDQLACLENIRGEREIPDHPLVQQSIHDCLTDTMDIDGLEETLKRIQAGELKVHCLDLNAPSPLAAEIINARPYAFLDDGEAENRRTRAISQSPDDLGNAATLSIITVEAETQVRMESWVSPRSADELHDGLMQLGFLTRDEFSTGTSSTGTSSGTADWPRLFRALTEDQRASCVSVDGQSWWVATERLGEFLAIHPRAQLKPDPRDSYDVHDVDPDRALTELLRSRLSGLGPVTEAILKEDISVSATQVHRALLALQSEGYAMVMGAVKDTWCERRLLARIHRYSRDKRRRRSKPVSPADFMRFLVHWHGLDSVEAERSSDLAPVLDQLEGWCAPAACWEHGLLANRTRDYAPHNLDQEFLSGHITWMRPAAGGKAHSLQAATPIAIIQRQNASAWRHALAYDTSELGSTAERIRQILEDRGAMFTVDLAEKTGLMPMQLEQGISELIARGLATADAFSPLRWLIRPEAQKRRKLNALRRRSGRSNVGLLGRWSLTEDHRVDSEEELEHMLFSDQVRLAAVCEALLRRYGVVFRALLARESLVPPWRYLLRYFRRMEDRGEVLGGRFVDGFSGEQFALSEAAGLLRRMPTTRKEGHTCAISAADPLNLGGIITPGVKTAARPSNRVLLVDGLPHARIQGDQVERLVDSGKLSAQEIEKYLRVVHGIPGSARVHT